MESWLTCAEQQIKASEAVRIAEVAALTRQLDGERHKVSLLNARLAASENECRMAKKAAEDAETAATSAVQAASDVAASPDLSLAMELRKYKGWAMERANQNRALQVELRKLQTSCADMSKQYAAKSRELVDAQNKRAVMGNRLLQAMHREKQLKLIITNMRARGNAGGEGGAEHGAD